MGKRKTTIKTIELSGNTDEVAELLDSALQKPVAITNASIKDGLCNYGYEILSGPGKGDKIPNRKGSNYIHDDMIDAFRELRVFLAVIDDAFKYSKDQLTSLDDMNSHDIADLFSVTGIRITGSEESIGYVLIGDKLVDAGVIGLESPKITAATAFPYFEELETAVQKVIDEVFEYMNGKAAPKMEQAELPFENDGKNHFENPVE